MNPSAVAALFGPFGALDWYPVGGGFSGAAVFADAGLAPAPPAYPPGTPARRVEAVHRWMIAAGRFDFVPAVFPPGVVHADGRVWELVRWMPGAADFRTNPSAARLAAACGAVARLHRVWRTETKAAPFPAVARRQAAIADWRASPVAPTPTDPALAAATRELVPLLRPLARWADADLAPLAGRGVAVHPCLCDGHHDHVLFTGDAVTGVIDYGAMKLDHPAVDLARLLGDLVGDDANAVAAGVAAYQAAGGSDDVTLELVTTLDRTGTVAAAAVWLMRLATDPTAGGRPAAAAERIARIVRRLRSGFADVGRP